MRALSDMKLMTTHFSEVLRKTNDVALHMNTLQKLILEVIKHLNGSSLPNVSKVFHEQILVNFKPKESKLQDLL